AEPAHHTVRITGRVTPDTFERWLIDAFRRLNDCIEGHGVRATGPPGTLWAPEIPLDEPEPVEAFVPIAEPVALTSAPNDIAIGEIPAARVAVLVHAGTYAAMPDTYRTLGAWVARHAEYAGGRIREWCTVGPGRTSAEAYRTEIAWPIAAT